MRIWIDLANSPHVHIYSPLRRHLEAKGHEIVFTLRDFAQTVEMARLHQIQGEVISGHGGNSYAGKSRNLAARSLRLVKHLKQQKIDLALSHNSYTQIIAARILGIPAVTMMDYEGQPANHIAFRLAKRVVVPEYFPKAKLEAFGARANKVSFYPGFKEQIYLKGFNYRPQFKEELYQTLGWKQSDSIQDKPLVVVRPPATMAAYHRFKNPLFDTLLHQLNQNPSIYLLVLPRTPQQALDLNRNYRNLSIPPHALDGCSLVAAADLVISAGGTMNREAAILGTPAYTLFAGALPAVDKALIKVGRMKSVRTRGHLQSIELKPKGESKALLEPGQFETISQLIEGAVS